MKNELKKKTDMKASGNEKITLKDWERKLLDIIDNDDLNPTLHKISGAESIGKCRNAKTSGHKACFNQASFSLYHTTNTKKSKLEGEETDETSKKAQQIYRD
nr:unnamed protein product [Callosobruchus chinensis]